MNSLLNSLVGFENCAVLNIKRGNLVYCEGIDLGYGVKIEEGDEEGSKYLGILEKDNISQEKMKEKVQKEYYKHVRAVLKYKLNGGNVINATSIWAVATVRYLAIIINWNKGVLDKMTDKHENTRMCIEVYTQDILLTGCT